jgi:DNA-directed RNA polymerase subunit K/omega
MLALTGHGGSNPPLSAIFKGASVSKNQHLSLETCYSKDISPFKAVIMSSQEARFINEQANLGFIKLAEKPTTIAIQKFKDGKLEIIKEVEAG